MEGHSFSLNLKLIFFFFWNTWVFVFVILHEYWGIKFQASLLGSSLDAHWVIPESWLLFFCPSQLSVTAVASFIFMNYLSQAAYRSLAPAKHFQASLVFKNSVWKPHMEASMVPQLIFSMLVKSIQLDNAHLGHSLRMPRWVNVQKPTLGDQCPPQSEGLCL